MWIDLACKHFKFHFFLPCIDLFFLHTFFDHVIHQFLYGIDHYLQIPVEIRDLILPADILRDIKISSCSLMHLQTECIYPRTELIGKYQNNSKTDTTQTSCGTRLPNALRAADPAISSYGHTLTKV